MRLCLPELYILDARLVQQLRHAVEHVVGGGALAAVAGGVEQDRADTRAVDQAVLHHQLVPCDQTVLHHQLVPGHLPDTRPDPVLASSNTVLAHLNPGGSVTGPETIMASNITRMMPPEQHLFQNFSQIVTRGDMLDRHRLLLQTDNGHSCGTVIIIDIDAKTLSY